MEEKMGKLTIAALDALQLIDIDWTPLEELGSVTKYDATAPELIIERAKDADVVLVNKVKMTRDVLQQLPKLKYIGVLATGYNIVDIAAAKELGIVVTNIPAYSTDSVAQLVFALLLEITHHVGHHNAAVQAGHWSNNADFCFWDYPLTELAGKTMGVVGYGRIGRRVGEIARAFGMNVLAYTRTPRDPECVSLDELLAKSDVISLHCPLFPETKQLINRETIAKMKDGAILINTSRGPVVDDDALAEALKSGKLYAVASDVAAIEPIPADNPLLGLENMIFTPHFGWATAEARVRLMDISVANVKAFIEGNPVNVVNK